MNNQDNKKMELNVTSIKLQKEHRRMLVLLIVGSVLLEFVLIAGLYAIKKDAERNKTLAYGRAVATSIELSLDKSISMSALINDAYQDEQDNFEQRFYKLGKHLLETDSLIESIYFAPEAVIQYAYPEKFADATIGFDILNDPEQAEAAQLAIDTQYISVGGPHQLIEGGVGFIIRNPLFENGEFKAFSIVVLDWERFSQMTLDSITDKSGQYHFAVWKENNDYTVEDQYGYIMRNSKGDIDDVVVVPIQIPNDTWYISVAPINGFISFYDLLPEIITSLLLIIFVIAVMYWKMLLSEKMICSVEYDELTGLYTKHTFYRYANELLEKYPDQQFDVIIADIENFKLINGIHGEKKADEVLRKVAKFFSGIDENAIYARFGGDQFVCMRFSNEKYDFLRSRELDGILSDEEGRTEVVVKYGIYQNVDNRLPIAIMCDRALIALRSIKRNYERNYAYFDGPISRKEFKARVYETLFHSSIKNEEFKVWFQPKFDTMTEEFVGAEALVRWVKDDGTIISPSEFIPVFEEDGLIAELDEYVFRKVCEYIKEWKEQGGKLVPISVNLSRASLRKDGVVKRYKEIAASMGIPSECVPIEITESANFSNENIASFTSDLKDKGFTLYMDDFGNGFSSLSSLNTLPFDLVKLDKSLIDYISEAGGKEIVRHIIELAHFKGMCVVAEGVETKEQLEILRTLQCDTVQGFYFAKPKPYEEFVQYIN